MPTTLTHEASTMNTYTTEEIVGAMPTNANEYTQRYQPVYPDREALASAVDTLQEMEPVVTPREIDTVQERLTELATGKIRDPIIITGRCSEDLAPLDMRNILVASAVSSIGIVSRGIGRAIHLLRAAGQDVKPRSAATEILEDGIIVPSFYGQAVNSPEKTAAGRIPDPQRMVDSAEQAIALVSGILDAGETDVAVAHEVLLMAREKAYVRIDPETGKDYLLSTVMGWIGKRTNQLDSEPVQLLKDCANPVGVKIGADSDAEHIKGLHETLNPSNIPGRLTFMLRIGREDREKLDVVAKAIAEHAPGALVMYDIHGTTRNVNGRKIRAVSDIIEDIAMVSDACHQAGTTLHGIHLETTTDDVLECVDTPDQIPSHQPVVDPLLNRQQTETILSIVREEGYLLRAPKATANI